MAKPKSEHVHDDDCRHEAEAIHAEAVAMQEGGTPRLMGSGPDGAKAIDPASIAVLVSLGVEGITALLKILKKFRDRENPKPTPTA